MKVAVFGAGALGSLIGGLLSDRNQVTLIGRERHMEAIRNEGLSVTGVVERVYHPTAKTTVEGMGEQEVVLITVKAYDTAAALRSIRPMVSPNTIVVSMQNGLNNADLITKEYGALAVIALTSLGSTYLSPGRVCFAGRGETVVGSLTGNEEATAKIGSLFEEAGIPCRLTDDIESELWLKAIVNACINPITALRREMNGCIALHPQLKKLARELCQEVSKAAEANQISLPVSDQFAKVMEVINLTSENKSSMLQDVEAGRRTEIDEITGELIRRGEEKGVELPRNRVLWSLLYRPPYF